MTNQSECYSYSKLLFYTLVGVRPVRVQPPLHVCLLGYNQFSKHTLGEGVTLYEQLASAYCRNWLSVDTWTLADSDSTRTPLRILTGQSNFSVNCTLPALNFNPKCCAYNHSGRCDWCFYLRIRAYRGTYSDVPVRTRFSHHWEYYRFSTTRNIPMSCLPRLATDLTFVTKCRVLNNSEYYGISTHPATRETT